MHSIAFSIALVASSALAQSVTQVPAFPFPPPYCVNNIQYATAPDTEPLNTESRINRAMNKTAMEVLTKYVDTTCAQHIVNDTLESGYYQQFYGRTPEQVYASYIKTYGPSEEGRGPLNQLGLASFGDAGDVHLLRRFSEYVAMVYCNDAEIVQRMSKLNLRVGDFIVDQYDNDHRGVLKFFIATNTKQNITAVVLRGTDNVVDAMLDFRVQPVPVNISALPIPSFPDGVTEGQVHQGFWQRYQHERRDIARKLRKVINKYDGQTDVVVVGHSLGAAWAFLETADLILREKIEVKALYAYGMPAVGDAAFVDALAQAIGPEKIIRVVNENDMVVHMGMPGGAQPKEPNERFVVQCDPYYGVKTCDGGRDPECSMRYSCMEWTWRRHSEFMGWSMREEFCNMTATVPESIYEGISPENPLSDIKVFDI